MAAVPTAKATILTSDPSPRLHLRSLGTDPTDTSTASASESAGTSGDIGVGPGIPSSDMSGTEILQFLEQAIGGLKNDESFRLGGKWRDAKTDTLIQPSMVDSRAKDAAGRNIGPASVGTCVGAESTETYTGNGLTYRYGGIDPYWGDSSVCLYVSADLANFNMNYDTATDQVRCFGCVLNDRYVPVCVPF